MADMFPVSDRSRTIESEITAFEEVATFLLQNEEAFPAWMRIVNGIVEDGRCLFTLSTGFAGSGPLDLGEDDSVYRFDGVPAPIVLHPTADRDQRAAFRIVGACLVHGLMHGEEFDEGNLETIILV
jgi:hypothetical protein